MSGMPDPHAHIVPAPSGAKAAVPPAPHRRPLVATEDAVAALVAAEGPRAASTIGAFRDLVMEHFARAGRDLPWRRDLDPYGILVSEVMLQQTQVERVASRWDRFLDRFPTFEALASAPLAEVLAEWQGLGYNRRAANLKRIAEEVVAHHGGALPSDPAVLRGLPGLGPATAASVSVFAYGTRAAFIETNIRAVYLHVFFADRDDVTDREIMPIAEVALPDDARTWHWALMDYGSMLKRTLPNPSRRSAHHTRQSRFEGSRRQLRGRVLRALLAAPGMTSEELGAAVDGDDRLADVVDALEREGMVARLGDGWAIA
jgi:A/G-specific adenine glycosylase